MRKSMFYVVAGILLLTSCSTPDLLLSKGLKKCASTYEVSGNRGWFFNKVIKYGNYHTSKIKKGWSMGYTFPFFLRFESASEKLQYKQTTPSGQSAEVFCVGKLKNAEISQVVDFFRFPTDVGIPLHYEDYFAGSVKNEHLNWDFILYNPDSKLHLLAPSRYKNTSGEIKNAANNERILISPVRQVEGKRRIKWLEKVIIYGFEFFQDGESIAAVSLMNKGKVWIKDDISNEKKLVLSSVITGLMVRQNLSNKL